MRLAAWVVSGNPSQTREFLLKLPTLSVQAGQQVQKNSTKQFGKSGEAGAVKGMSIPFRLMFHSVKFSGRLLWRRLELQYIELL